MLRYICRHVVLVDLSIQDEHICRFQLVCVPNFEASIHATREEHACVQWIPLNTFYTILVTVSALSINFAHTLACTLQAAREVEDIMYMDSSICSS